MIAARARLVTPTDDEPAPGSPSGMTRPDARRRTLGRDRSTFTRGRRDEMITRMATIPRPARRDIAYAAVLSVLGTALMYDNALRIERDGYVPGSDQTANVHIEGLLTHWAALPLFLLVTVPVAWRRVAPLAAAGAFLAGFLLNVALVGSEFLRCGVTAVAAATLVFGAADVLRLRDALVALGLALTAVVLDLALTFGPWTAVVFAVAIVACWGAGRLVRSRRGMVAELERQTEQLRVARDERARLEVAGDRLRLSGELDALLQQRLAALARLAESEPEPDGSAAVLVALERESRATLGEMREVIGTLRDPDGERPASPVPALAQLDALIARAGNDAHLQIAGTPRALPAGVELSAYRVVEHLLAAVESTAGVDVAVRFADDGLGISVTGPADRHGRAALERARQRVQLHRGTLESTVRGGRAVAVAWLPIATG
jgi:signal transduction histidine kinase